MPNTVDVLSEILSILQIATGAAQELAGGIPGVAGGAAIAAALEQIAAKAVATYQAQTGTPLDLSKLLPETPIQLPPA